MAHHSKKTVVPLPGRVVTETRGRPSCVFQLAPDERCSRIKDKLMADSNLIGLVVSASCSDLDGYNKFENLPGKRNS